MTSFLLNATKPTPSNHHLSTSAPELPSRSSHNRSIAGGIRNTRIVRSCNDASPTLPPAQGAFPTMPSQHSKGFSSGMANATTMNPPPGVERQGTPPKDALGLTPSGTTKIPLSSTVNTSHPVAQASPSPLPNIISEEGNSSTTQMLYIREDLGDTEELCNFLKDLENKGYFNGYARGTLAYGRRHRRAVEAYYTFVETKGSNSKEKSTESGVFGKESSRGFR
eukprot:PhF_6_TR13589/c0_g1_i2/m.21738